MKPAPVVNERSGLPSAFSLIILLLLIPLKKSKDPERTILPSGCIWTSSTTPLAPTPITKSVSTAPLGNNLITRLAVTPLYFIKLPATITLPFDCKAKLYTIPLLAAIIVLKETSIDPSLLSRINRFAVIPLKLVNAPPKSIFPSGCSKEQYTLPLKLVPKLKEVSLEPS